MFFGLFTGSKKVRSPPLVRVRSCWGEEVTSWTPAAHHGCFFADDAPAAHLADIVLESNMWRDEAGHVWMHMSANPSRWYLLQNPTVHWDEPG